MVSKTVRIIGVICEDDDDDDVDEVGGGWDVGGGTGDGKWHQIVLCQAIMLLPK